MIIQWYNDSIMNCRFMSILFTPEVNPLPNPTHQAHYAVMVCIYYVCWVGPSFPFPSFPSTSFLLYDQVVVDLSRRGLSSDCKREGKYWPGVSLSLPSPLSLFSLLVFVSRCDRTFEWKRERLRPLSRNQDWLCSMKREREKEREVDRNEGEQTHPIPYHCRYQMRPLQ